MDGRLSLHVVRKLFAEQQLSSLATLDVHPFLLRFMYVLPGFQRLKLSTSNSLFNDLLVRGSLSVKQSLIQRIHRQEKEDFLHDRARRRPQNSKSAKQRERIGTNMYRKVRLEVNAPCEFTPIY